jgi:hypothetical protein
MRIHSPQITGSAENTNIVTVTRITSLSALSASFASTASYANNFTVGGTLTAQTINVQTITSSIDYVTGSSINGSLLSNTHQITGSTSITGSLQVNNSNVILSNQTSSMSVATASYWSGSITNAATASYVAQAQSASYWSGSIINSATASYVLNAVSASFALTASYISGSGGGVGFPFSGSAIITGSLFVSGSTISGSFVGDGSGITGLTAGGKIHTQTSAASTWTVTHNLGVQYPNVTVYNSLNEIIIPQTIVATDSNTLTLTFGSAVAGYAVAGIGGIINVQGRTTQQYFTASTTWSFAHNLGDKYVSLQAFDDAFEMVIPTTVRLVDATSSLMLFDSASSGYAVATIGGDLPAISSSYAGYTLQVASSAPYSASWVAVPNVTVTNAVSSSFAATASSADNLTVRGTLTAQTINVQTITSSIEFITGSTRNGTLLTNTHEFTGSVLMSGSLGIGTSSPLAPLYILAPTTIVDSNGQLFVGASDVLGADKGGQIMLGGKYTSTVNTAFGGIAAKKDNATDGNFGGYLQFFSSTHGVGNTEKMRITSTGNVGIGTSSPNGRLDVKGATATTSSLQIDNGGATYGNYIQSYGSGTYDRLSLIGGDILFFGSGPTERMRITSGGVVQISNAGDAQLHINASGATGYVKYDNSSSDTWGTGIGFNIATNFELYNFTTATYGFRVTRSGIYATTATSPRSVFVQSDGTLGGISSVRESKTNITSLDSSWLMQLNPVSFNYRKKDTEDKYTNEHYDELFYGLIAEEVESVNKEICTYNEDKLIGLEYIKLITPMLKTIQELSAKNTALEERLTALENK